MNKDVLFDKRLIQRHIKLGYITYKDVDEYLTGLVEGSRHPEYKDFEIADFTKRDIKWKTPERIATHDKNGIIGKEPLIR